MKQLEEFIGKILRMLSAFCLGIVFVLFIANVITRLKFIMWNPKWIDETIMFFLVWMIFLTAAELTRTRSHFVVDYLTDKVHGKLAGRIMALVATTLMLVTYGVILFFGIRLCMSSGQTMPTLPFLKKSVYYACIPVAAGFMTIFTLRDLVLCVQDIITKGKVTEKLDLEKQKMLEEDDDVKAIAEAAEALRQDAES